MIPDPPAELLARHSQALERDGDGMAAALESIGRWYMDQWHAKQRSLDSCGSLSQGAPEPTRQTVEAAFQGLPRGAICGAPTGIRGFEGMCTRRPGHRGTHYDARYDVLDGEDGNEISRVPEPSRLEVAALMVLNALPGKERREAMVELKAAYIAGSAPAVSRGPAPEWMRKIAAELPALIEFIRAEHGPIGWELTLTSWMNRLREYVVAAGEGEQP